MTYISEHEFRKQILGSDSGSRTGIMSHDLYRDQVNQLDQRLQQTQYQLYQPQRTLKENNDELLLLLEDI